MNKKGLTLVEVICAIAVLAILAVVAVPIVTRTISREKSKSDNLQEANIKAAAENYMADHLGVDIDPNSSGGLITLRGLANEGYLDSELKDPKTANRYDLDHSTVRVEKVGSEYKYTVILVTN